MMEKLINLSKKSAISLVLFMMLAPFFRCASNNKAADVQVEETRRITAIMTSENTRAVNVFVKGNQNLE